MSALGKTNDIIDSLEEQANEALSHVGKDRVDMEDRAAACIALKNIKDRIEELRDATEDAWQDAYAAGEKAERWGR